MDDPSADPALLADSLRFIRRINAALRYTRTTLSYLDRWSRQWPTDRPIKILDVATGSADVPKGILRWADRARIDVSVTGIDLHAVTAREAAAADRRLKVVRGDAMQLPFADGAFDYVLTSMFLHHLDDAQIVAVLREMDRVASRGMLAADLSRNRRAYGWISLFTLMSNPMVQHDARASVAQAFTLKEVDRLRNSARLTYCTVRKRPGHRFVLAGEKSIISRCSSGVTI